MREPAPSCSVCGKSLLPQDVLYTERGDLICDQCTNARKAAAGHHASDHLAGQLAYGNPLLGLASFFFDPLFLVSAGAIGNALFTFRRLRSDASRGEGARHAGWRKLAAGVGLLLAMTSIGARIVGKVSRSEPPPARRVAATPPDKEAPTSRVQAAFKRGLAPLFQNQDFIARVQSDRARRAGGAAKGQAPPQLIKELMERGLPRLGDEDVVSYVRMQAKLVGASEHICLCEAEPARCQPERFLADVDATLTDPELESYAKLRAAAIQAGLATDEEAPGGDDKQFAEALAAVTKPMKPDERDSFFRVLEAPEAASVPERCTLARTLYGGVEQVPARLSVAYARVLVGRE